MIPNSTTELSVEDIRRMGEQAAARYNLAEGLTKKESDQPVRIQDTPLTTSKFSASSRSELIDEVKSVILRGFRLLAHLDPGAESYPSSKDSNMALSIALENNNEEVVDAILKRSRNNASREQHSDEEVGAAIAARYNRRMRREA